MALNHDQDGFLRGPKVGGELDKIGRDIEILKAIRADTESTVSMLGVIADALTAPSGRLPEPVTPNTPNVVDVASDLEGAVRRGMAGAMSNRSSPEAPSTTGNRPSLAGDSTQTSAAPSVAPGPTSVRAPALPGGVPAASSTASVVNIGPDLERAIRRGMAGASPLPAPAPVRAPSQPSGAPVTRVRDNNGRFGADRRPAEPDAGNKDRDSGDGRAAKAMDAASESLRNAAQGFGTSTDNIDPTVQAVKEVGSIVSPVTSVVKPMGRLFGGRQAPEEKRQRQNVQWYRRIVGAVKGGGGGGAGGMGLIGPLLLSMLGMLLAPIKALGRMLGALRAVAALGAMFKGLARLAGFRGPKAPPAARRAPGGPNPPGSRGAPNSSAPGRKPGSNLPGAADARNRPGGSQPGGRGAPGAPRGPGTPKGGVKGFLGKGLDFGKNMLGKGAGLMGGGGKSLLRKIPFLGTLLGAGMLASAFTKDEDANATAEEKQSAKADKWGTVGGVLGGVVGGVAGSFLGPAGTVAGGIAGDMLGQQMGEWLSTVDFSAVAASISDSFNGLVDATSKMASSAFDSLKSGWTDMVGKGAAALTGLTDWAKEKWAAANDLVDSAKESVGNGVTTVKNAGQNVLNTVTGGRYSGGSNARKDELIKAMDAGGITDPKSKAMLMANVDHESQGFTKNEENLNYSAKRLQEVFPKYYSNPEDAARDAKNPEAIANKVYGGRMGNVDPGDGFKYRGRGDLQLTGRAQYAAMGKQLGVDLENNPDLAMDPKVSAKIAVAHWKTSGADRAASTGDLVRARKLTNGGTNGLEDVTKKYNETYLAQAKAGDLTPTRQANEVRVAAPAAASGAIAGTMAAIKGAGGTPAVAGATAAPGITAAAGAASTVAGGVQPVGIMAMSSSAPAGAPGTVTAGTAMRVATAAPTSMPNLVTPTYSAPATDATKTAIPSTPLVAKPNIPVGKDAGPAPVKLTLPLTQNLEDRQIAHAANGGIGMGTGRPM